MGNFPKLRIALCTYSTNARGGVAHTLALAEALAALGQDVHIFALGKDENSKFPRPVSVPYTLIPTQVEPVGDEPLDQRIERYIQTYYEFFSDQGQGSFDIYHAQDCISANALFQVRDEGLIPHFFRTIHHLDDFNSPSLIECQDNSVYRPDYPIVVSRYWQERLADEFQVNARIFYNGVDLNRFSLPTLSERSARRAEWGLTDEFVCLHIGGILPRKNNIRLLAAFQAARNELDAQGKRCLLLMAGGATLLDYRDYEAEFYRELNASDLVPGEDISLLGSVEDSQILSLYQAADLLVFPSVKEGWGLVTLEAMASGLAVLTSDLPVFREYLQPEKNALLVNPYDETAIAAGICRLAVDTALRQNMVIEGRSTAEAYSWAATARRHLEYYLEMVNTLTFKGVT